MPSPPSKSPSLILIDCPVCGKSIKQQGLFAHLRMTHPQEDTKKHLRNVIIPKPEKHDRVIFQVLQKPNGDFHYKWIKLKTDELAFLKECLQDLISRAKTQ